MAFFIPDLSSWQGNLPDFSAIAARPDMVGCIIKSSQGLGPGVRTDLGHSPTWFADNWTRVRDAGGSRYGTSWFRGSFHFASPNSSGAAQADYVLATVDRAGGWGEGDLPPAWDLEGDAWTSAQQIIDASSQFAERIFAKIGRRPILYTGSTWRKFDISDRAGFGSLWTTHLNLMWRYGWPNENVILHQYVGSGKYYNPSGEPAQLGYPKSVQGIDGIDINVVLDGGVPATSIERVRDVLTSGGGAFQSPSRGSDSRVSAPARTGGGLSTRTILGIGAGLLALGILAAAAGGDDDLV